MRRIKNIDFSNPVYGKVPPQAKDLEMAVLGAIMLEKRAFDIVAELLKPECFYVDAHQRIYSAFKQLQDKGQPIDMLTVVEHLRSTEEIDLIGGPYYITRVTEAVSSAAHIEAHSKIIIQKFIQREVIRISGEMAGNAYEDSADAFELLDNFEAQVFNISAANIKSNYQKAGSGLFEIVKRIEGLRNREVSLTGVPTGFRELDILTCGWQEPDLIILAARPSVGKTALALNLARNAANNNFPVGFFSLEMSMRQCRERLLSAESKINLSKITRGRMDDEEMKNLIEYGVKPIDALELYIDDTSALSIYQLRSKARSMVHKHGVKIIFLDYLQLMSGLNSGRNENREQEISKISRGLKGLAKEMNIPIVALSQLSRGVESRSKADQMPKLSDLRDSGAIEQDADVVIFMYRPEYYGIHTNEKGESTKGETHLWVAKHRNGPLDLIKLTAKLHIQKFVEFEYLQPEPGKVNGFIPIAQAKGKSEDEYLF